MTVALLTVFVGCTATASLTTPPQDAAPDRNVEETDGGQPAPVDVPAVTEDIPVRELTYDYVISGLTIDDGMNVDMPAAIRMGLTGFDLDGIKSGPSPAAAEHRHCAHGDFFSTLDPDQNMGTCADGMMRGGPMCVGGVDNQLPNIASTLRSLMPNLDLRGSLSTAVAGGSVNILMRVSGVNGTPAVGFNDSSVTVRFYPIGRPLFASCSNISTPGQGVPSGMPSYAIDTASLTNPSDLNSTSLVFQGSIVNGRLRLNPPTSTTTPNFRLPLAVSGRTVNIDLYSAQMRVDLTSDRGMRGNLGGYIRLSDLVTVISNLGLSITPEQIRQFAPILQGFIDVEVPSGDAMGCGERADDAGIPSTGGIGFGVGVTVTRAQISGMTVTGEQPGMCGTSSTPSDGGAPADASTPRD